MARNFDIICNECDAKVHIQEFPMGVPGGKEKEEVDCPKCGNQIYEAMTDGWFVASLIESSNEDTLGSF